MPAAIGIDVGASTIKMGVMDESGQCLASGPYWIATPTEPSVANVVETVASLSRPFVQDIKPRRVGVALPAIVKQGRYAIGMGLAADWHRSDARRLLEEQIGSDIALINDADAAGIAEMTLGEAASTRGTVIVLTLGTFVGSAVFYEGRLVPNTELGQLEIGGRPAELKLGGRAKLARGLPWREWGEEFSTYLKCLDAWFSPDLVVLAGGMTREAEAFLPYVECPSALKVSRFADAAGIIGAALFSRTDPMESPRIGWAQPGSQIAARRL